MAAAEYYMGTAHELPGNRPPHAYPAQPQPNPPPYQQQYPQQQYNTTYNTAPPQQQQLQTYSPAPSQQQHNYQPNVRPPPPYPIGPPQFPTGPSQQQNTFLGPPIQPIRSHSQPPRVHFADKDEYNSSSSSSSSSSRSSSPDRRRSHRRHRSRDNDYDDDSRRHRSSGHHETRIQRREHKDRDTFLGAGAGALVGDVIFPGLGTAAGILLGGLGGRKYARSKSEDGHAQGRRRRGREDEYDDGYESSSADERRRRGHGHEKEYGVRRGGKWEGWDERSATYKSGTAVR